MNSTAGINKALSQLTQVFTKRIFFVGGMIKSGTTWFERLLDTHPEIVCKGEAHFATQIVSPLAHLVEEYNTEIVTKGGVIAHLKQFGGGTEVLEFDDNDTMVLSAVAVGLMFAKWIPNDHIKCIGDKTPGNIDNMTLLASLFPEARFFNMIRDGRDAAVSAWHFNLKLDIGDTIKKWGSFDKFVGAFAEAWMTGIVNSRNQAKSLGPERYREITY